MALKFSKEKKDPTQKLINFGFKSLLGPIGTAGLEYAKNQIAKNIVPVGYHTPLKRIKGAIFGGEYGAGDPRNSTYKNDQNTMERRDLLSMMMVDKQQNNTIPVSKYRPTSSKNKNSVYYSSPTTEKNIKERIDSEGIENVLSGFQPNKQGVSTWMGYGTPSNIDTNNSFSNSNVLGNYTMQLGEDDEGKYMSYYDKWDLNPFEDKNKILDAMATGAQYAAGVNPAEVYGRIYYEPKLKSPISGIEIDEEK